MWQSIICIHFDPTGLPIFLSIGTTRRLNCISETPSANVPTSNSPETIAQVRLCQVASPWQDNGDILKDPNAPSLACLGPSSLNSTIRVSNPHQTPHEAQL